MDLSLSVRVVETADKTRLRVPFGDFVRAAAATGYQAICMRASAGGTHTSLAELRAMRALVEQYGLYISMVTADFDVPLNNGQGPDSLRNIGPSLAVAEALGCDLLRVCLKTDEDIVPARAAADAAAAQSIRLVHQCHNNSMFEVRDAPARPMPFLPIETFP